MKWKNRRVQNASVAGCENRNQTVVGRENQNQTYAGMNKKSSQESKIAMIRRKDGSGYDEPK